MSEPSNEPAKPKTWTRRLGSFFRWLHTYISLLGFLALLFFAVTGFMLNHAEWFYSGEAAMRQMQGRIDPALLEVGASEVARTAEPYVQPSPSDGLGVGPPPEESAVPPPLEETPGPPLEATVAPPPGGAVAALPPGEEMAAPPPPDGAAASPLDEMAPPPLDQAGALPATEEPSAPSLPGGMDGFAGPAPGAGTEAVDKLAVAEALRSRHRLRGVVTEFAVDPYQCMVTFHGPGYLAQALVDRASGEYNLSEIRPGVLVVLQDLHRGTGAGRVWSWVIDTSAAIMTVASITGLALLLFYRRRRFTGLVTAVLGSVAVLVIYLLYVP